LQTVSTSEALQAAKPLTQSQAVEKGKVWILLCGGAAGLFAATLLLENQSKLFPAIARANQAMAAARKKPGTEEDDGDSAARDMSVHVDQEHAHGAAPRAQEGAMSRSEEAVLQGLQAAREKVLQENNGKS
jgi:putative intracellular protease/amidase